MPYEGQLYCLPERAVSIMPQCLKRCHAQCVVLIIYLLPLPKQWLIRTRMNHPQAKALS